MRENEFQILRGIVIQLKKKRWKIVCEQSSNLFILFTFAVILTNVFTGYTKVGDNSAINSMALLAGRAFEAKYRGLDELLDKDQYLNENQTFDDIFKHVNMLFDDMKRDGCATMFNDGKYFFSWD